MDLEKLLKYLAAIAGDPNEGAVEVTKQVNGNTAFEFYQDIKDPKGRRVDYYFPYGIQRIYIDRAGGAGAVYVYTTSEQYPHLTITDKGKNVHWTDKEGVRGVVEDRAPECIQALLKLY